MIDQPNHLFAFDVQIIAINHFHLAEYVHFWSCQFAFQDDQHFMDIAGYEKEVSARQPAFNNKMVAGLVNTEAINHAATKTRTMLEVLRRYRNYWQRYSQ